MGKYRVFLILAACIGVVQVALSLSGKAFYLTQLTMSAYYSLVVIGLCLLMGFAGQISMGHAGFFAIGGYLQARLTTLNLLPWNAEAPVHFLRTIGILVERQDLYGAGILSFSPWAALACAILAATVVAWLIGIPVLRLKGHYLAMATLGFGLIVYRLALATPGFGGADGLTGVPAFPLIFGLRITGGTEARPANFLIAWTLVILALAAARNLIDSRIGRALRAIHGSEEAASMLGVDTGRYKQMTFVLSAVLAAAGGVFLTHYNGGIGPSEALVMKSIRYVAIVAVGGMDNLWGALLMGTVLNFLSLRGVFGSFDDAVFGGVLILIMLFAPRGLLHAGWSAAILEKVRLFRARSPRNSRAPSEAGEAGWSGARTGSQ